ncbi:hypothetical protein [Hyphomicrobium sp.]|jgi:hypothetical protein|uniref:hypothetical protein n=1 Tax=Hyphomicrobium sp. TaxID=82 RepID=UPI002C485412|nr:hypothetical protein [Hyphomicrobium sp.]HVZ03863.1 hypothetical protein [Hyphomicrobium sp.]
MRIHHYIAGAAFAAAIAVSGGALAFETTSLGGTNPDGSAQFQDPDEKPLSGPLGGLQFGVTSSGGNNSSDDDTGRPPWEIKPPPARSSFTGAPLSGPSWFRAGQ